METNVRNRVSTIDASVVLKEFNPLIFQAGVVSGDRGQRDRLTALLRDRLQGFRERSGSLGSLRSFH
jgi:hypothetical protein